jgi:uncharacterized protein YcfL
MKKKTSVALLLFVFLVACVGQQQTHIQQSAPIAIATSSLLATSVLTQKPMLTPTLSRTFEPEFLTAKANTESQMRKQAATDVYFYSFCGNSLFPDWGLSRSPVKEIAIDWAEIGCRSNDWSERYQKFIYRRGEKIWTVSLNDKTLFSLNDKYDISLKVGLWSKDGKYLYLSSSYHLRDGFIDGWSPYMIFGYATGFYRLNLETGDFEAVLNPNSISGLEFSYALSPDERYLAFASELDKNAFYIRDMRTGLDRRFELNSKIENVGDFVWTPDSKKVVFTAALQGWYDKRAGTSLYVFDIQISALDILLYNDSQQRAPFFNSDAQSYWLRENVLYLMSAQQYDISDEWAFDVNTRSIMLISTEAPQP